ncbi:MAG: YegP family protein [Candidatus Thermoplasmatota archaeon]|nr:YegP family protein [Candidatus Thermoplasmatota archaeon]
MLARYEYWQSEEDEQWYFHLKAPANGIIVQSAGYATEDDCLEGIEQVRRYADVAIVTTLPVLSFD